MSKTEIATLLALMSGTHRHAATSKLLTDIRVERCRALNEYGILSLEAISATVGCSVYQTKQAIYGMPRPKARGKLNPRHIAMLAHCLSRGKIPQHWLTLMLAEGTSLSTISDLTGISPATLHRRKQRG